MNRSFSAVRILRMGFLLLCLFSLTFCSKPEKSHPFSYDLHLTKVPGSSSKALICCHGMGGNYQIIEYVQKASGLDATLISFNFPDYGIRVGAFDPEKTSLGTLDELLPALYVLKRTVVDEKFKQVSLYGFSAGGGALINMLAVLNSSSYEGRLLEIGIGPKEKKKIWAALQKGAVLLDAPLKSLDEMLVYHEKMRELDIISARYKENGMEPIENINKLQGQTLKVLVNFQVPDEILSNRDDMLYIERLKQVNPKNSVLFVTEGQGHSLPHPHLWDLYLSSL